MTRTGATEEQVCAVADDLSGYLEGIGLGEEFTPASHFRLANRCASVLVPEDSRIISVDDLKRLFDGYSADSDPRSPDEIDEFMYRIDALIAGDAS